MILYQSQNQQQKVKIIYLGRAGQTTQRKIRPLVITNGRLKAYCLTRQAPRVFIIANILAVEPVVNRHAV